MTVSTTAVSVSYAGDGSTTAFPITFQFGTSADLSVALIDADGNETAQALTTNYTVSQSAGGTGTLTMLTAPASGYTLRIRRITAKTQPGSLRNMGSYYPETVEQMFDRNTRQIQEVQEATERSLRFPFGSSADGELATPVAGGVPMVNDTGTGFSWALWGTNPEALASLAMGTGSTLVGFKQSGTGAVPRTMQEKGREIVTPEDFGAIGDGASHPLSERYATLAAAQVNYPFATALTQEIDYCAIIAAITSQTFGVPYYISGPEVNLRDGANYYCGSDTIQLKRSVRMRGPGSGLPTTSMPQITFAEDTGGIIVHRYNTIDYTTEGTPTTAADGTVLEGFIVQGTVGTNEDAHGVQLRARAVCRNLQIGGFTGDGYHVEATATTSVLSRVGNANNFCIEGGRVSGCRHGIYAFGADVNAGRVIGVDSSANRRSGIYDSSFLGNTYIGCHTSSNGKQSQVHYDGSRYYCMSDTLGGATTPGTDSTVWVRVGAGGVHSSYPDWVPGGTYYIGSAYRTDNSNARNVFIGCYSEGGQPASVLVTPTIVVGGLHGAGFDPTCTAPYIEGAGGTLQVNRSIRSAQTSAAGVTVSSSLSSDPATGNVLGFGHSDAGPSGWNLRVNGNEIEFNYAGAAASVPFKITGPSTALAFGRSAPVTHAFMARRLWLGDGALARFRGTGTSEPTSGEYGRGDIIYNVSASAGGKIGWVCTTAGTAGSTAVFKQFGAIDA